MVLRHVHVVEGENIRKGQPIATIVNEEIEDRVLALRNELRTEELKLEVHHLLNENDEYAVTQDAVLRIQQELKEWESVRQQLIVTSPFDGKVLPAAQQPLPKMETVQDQLSKWASTPLSLFNRGAFIEPGTLICTTSGDEAFDAIVLLDQHDRIDVVPGQKVRLLCQAFPLEVLDGKVTEISQRHLEFAPRNLSNKLGGELATVTDSRGRERLGSNVYQIRIAIHQTNLPIRLGMRGDAKVLLFERSASQLIWRFLRQTFLFRL